MIRLFCMDVGWLNDDELFYEYQKKLSETRRKRVDAFNFRHDKNLSLGVGILLDCGLKEYGLNERDMEYGVFNNGKPYFMNEPAIRFNLSHSGTKALAAFSDAEIGCDIEKIREIDLKIAERFFSKGECSEIMKKDSPQERNEAFFRIWTFKESFIKAAGLGLKRSLDSFEIIPGSGAASAFRDVDGEEYRFREFDTIPGYKCTLCMKGVNDTAELRFVEV